MDQGDQIEAFSSELDALVDRYGSEFDLSMAAAVGVLHMKAHALCVVWQKNHEEGDEDE